LSEEQRAEVHAPLTEEERRRALAEGTPKASARYIGRFVAGLVILGVLGLVADYFFGQVGTIAPGRSVTTTTNPATHPIQTNLNALMSLKPIANASAPAIALTDQAGQPWTLASVRDKVVVLTFFNANCRDICPVLGDEIRRADAVLGARSSEVAFVIVNTDPHDLAVRADPPALALTGLDHLSNVYFLNGSISALDPVWTSYQVTITVAKSSGQMAHNAIMYFIGRHGGLSDQATPFANESHRGVFTLGSRQVSQWAQGIARTAGSLLR
jgi:protein SCO1